MAFSYKDDENIYKNPLKLIKVAGAKILCRYCQEKCFPFFQVLYKVSRQKTDKACPAG